jgi:hypothetical protein
MPNKKKERKNNNAKKSAPTRALDTLLDLLPAVFHTFVPHKRLVLDVQRQIQEAITLDNAQLLNQIFAPPRLGVAVTDNFLLLRYDCVMHDCCQD